MSEFKGTPGPWKARNLGTEIAVFGSYRLCGMTGGEIQRDKANARLIAAAPDLLKVLQEVQEFAQGWSQYEMPIGLDDRINAAIAKALNTNTTER